MKANEAPEKIYIHPDIGGKEFLRPWLHRPANNESVEYVRKDAFIEKACKWLEDNLWDYWGQKNAAPDSFIEEFRIYILKESEVWNGLAQK